MAETEKPQQVAPAFAPTPLHACAAAQEMPREKLLRVGRGNLTDEELLALFLRTGVRGCNVLELAHSMLRDVGSLGQLMEMDVRQLQRLTKGIGVAKAATLAAAFELGKRAARANVSRTHIRDSRAVYEYLVDILRTEPQECLMVMLLNSQNELMRCVEVAKGTLTRVMTHPRDVFRDAVCLSASRIILTHNHPSGSVVPSREDVELTRCIAAAGDVLRIPLADHVIIGYMKQQDGDAYYSFRDAGML